MKKNYRGNSEQNSEKNSEQKFERIGDFSFCTLSGLKYGCNNKKPGGYKRKKEMVCVAPITFLAAGHVCASDSAGSCNCQAMPKQHDRGATPQTWPVPRKALREGALVCFFCRAICCKMGCRTDVPV